MAFSEGIASRTKNQAISTVADQRALEHSDEFGDQEALYKAGVEALLSAPVSLTRALHTLNLTWLESRLAIVLHAYTTL